MSDLSSDIVSAARRGPASRPAVPPNLSKVRNVVAVGSGKGGVGKSTVTVNLAVALARRGAKVGVLDADVYGPSQPGLLGAGTLKAESSSEILEPLEAYGVRFMSVQSLIPRDAPVVWRAPMAVKLLQDFIAHVAWGELDYLLIDLPPGTGDVQLTMAQSAGLTGSVVVTTPQRVALDVARKGLRMFQQVKVPILGVVENMSGYVCPHCGNRDDVFLSGGGEAMAAEEKIPFLGALPLDGAVVKSGDGGVPVTARTEASPLSEACGRLADAFEREVARSHGRSSSAASDFRVSSAGALEIGWADGSRSVLDPYHLRLGCPCAACVDERTGEKILDARRVPLDVRVAEVRAVGNYGLAPRFSDGHQTGIFTFERLKSMQSGTRPETIHL